MDIFRFNTTNLDPLTETYGLDFYFSYLARWPSLFSVAEDPSGNIDGYIMGKLEASPAYMSYSEHALPWHGHITALTVAPTARRLGLARVLSQSLETASDNADAYFVDLFVRKSNKIAIGLYTGLGYKTFRRVLEYYSDDPTPGAPPGRGEDALDMRKRLKRDKTGKHERENGENFTVNPEDVW
jgi:N-terminal acetyltransferase B complex catalytic subunit